VVVHNPPLLAIKAIHKGEAGVERLVGLMELEAVGARIGGLIAAQQDVTAAPIPRCRPLLAKRSASLRFSPLLALMTSRSQSIGPV